MGLMRGCIDYNKLMQQADGGPKRGRTVSLEGGVIGEAGGADFVAKC